MKWFYIRWGLVLLAGTSILLLGVLHYERELKTISPGRLKSEPAGRAARVRGMVLPGTLNYDPASHRAEFQLSAEGASIPVRYSGEAPENLRELKILVVVGRWDPASESLEAGEITLVPNFGFVAAAYLIGLVPMGLFLFRMERKVALLYREIRNLKIYEPEMGRVDAG